MFETEPVGPCLVRKLKGGYDPLPPPPLPLPVATPLSLKGACRQTGTKSFKRIQNLCFNFFLSRCFRQVWLWLENSQKDFSEAATRGILLNTFLKILQYSPGKSLCLSLFLIKLQALRNFEDHLFWRTSANGCICLFPSPAQSRKNMEKEKRSQEHVFL